MGIARSANAERYAPNTLAKAQLLLTEAQQLHASKADRARVIQSARQAAETAEDARLIAEKQKQEDTVANAHAEVSRAQQETARAENDAQLARSQAQASQAQADAERSARQRAEADADAARQRATRAEAKLDASPRESSAVVVVRPAPADSGRKAALRISLLEQLNGTFATRDTPRGLVVTIPDTDFRGDQLAGETSATVARISAIVEAHPGLRIEIEGHADSEAAAASASKRAEEVRAALVSRGLPAGTVISARGWGASRPLVSNASPGGREQNRRVEIVISGEPIGDLASWDHTYSLTAR
jgi:outer membrane protein OmpA-like peptidoglycan-associated protein